MTPPGLAWLASYCGSTGIALDQTMVADVQNTVNPLVYTVSVSWQTPVSPENALKVWNLFQKWAARNKAAPSGRVKFEERPHLDAIFVKGFSVEVHLRERLGLPRDDHP